MQVDCENRDQIHGENLTEQLAAISKVFWPRDITATTSRIIPCSSLMGLSARALLDLSGGTAEKPSFAAFWDDNRTKVTHVVSQIAFSTPPLIQCTVR